MALTQGGRRAQSIRQHLPALVPHCTAAANTNRQARHHKWLDLGKTPIGTKVAYEHPTRPEWLWRIIIGLKTQGDTAVALAKLMA